MRLSGAHIGVVDDDEALRTLLSATLEAAGYQVTTARTGAEIIHAIDRGRIDLVLLDIGLPDGDGIEVLERIRRDTDLPVIIISGRGDQAMKLRGFGVGADDYVAKPFYPKELLARVAAVLRRREAPPDVGASGVVGQGDIEIDIWSRTAKRSGTPVDLTPREFDLLAHLLLHPGIAFSREDLLRAVWGSSGDWQDERTVTEHIRRLRLKLEHDSSVPCHFLTVRGHGYRFAV